MKTRLTLLLLAVLAALPLGCRERGIGRTPENTFRQVYMFCVHGQFQRAHQLYSHRLKQVISLRDMEQTYADPNVRKRTKELLSRAGFRVKKYALNHAFAEVIWPDGETQDMTFILEDGVWKIDITAVNPDTNVKRLDDAPAM